jgi:hypothetical protein
VIEFIGRDEYLHNESKTYKKGFKDGEIVDFNIVGYFIVPGKILVLVGEEIKGLIEVPCLALAENSWYKLKETREFCESAVQKKGSPFRDLSLSVGDKTKTANIKCRFSEIPLTAHYVQLEEAVQVPFVTKTIY